MRGLTVIWVGGYVDGPLARASRIERIVFTFDIQEFIRHRLVPVNMNMSLNMWAPQREIFLKTGPTILIKFRYRV
jgi:hypothetical protein